MDIVDGIMIRISPVSDVDKMGMINAINVLLEFNKEVVNG
jgi:hypothetical protein